METQWWVEVGTYTLPFGMTQSHAVLGGKVVWAAARPGSLDDEQRLRGKRLGGHGPLRGGAQERGLARAPRPIAHLIGGASGAHNNTETPPP